MASIKISSKHVLFLVFLFLSLPSNSQNPIQPQPSIELEEAAREVSEFWEEELSLSPKQMELMEGKFIEYAMKKNEAVNSNMPEQEKTQTLEELQLLEDGDMRNILTGPQYERYLRVRSVREAQQQSSSKDTIK